MRRNAAFWRAGRRFLRLASAGVLAATFACAPTRPPADVQAAIRVIGRQLPPYVAEANRALGEVSHPEAERLQGIGDRLVRAVAALELWAGGTNASGAPSGNAPAGSAFPVPSGSAPDQPALEPAPSGCAPGSRPRSFPVATPRPNPREVPCD
jgi:hypothetical protein